MGGDEGDRPWAGGEERRGGGEVEEDEVFEGLVLYVCKYIVPEALL